MQMQPSALSVVVLSLVTLAFNCRAQPESARKSAPSESEIRASLARLTPYAKAVQNKFDPETAQDGLVIMSMILLQDAWSDLKINPIEVEQLSGRIGDAICRVGQVNATSCAKAVSSLNVVGALYKGVDPGPAVKARADVDLMDAIVDWVERNPAPLPLQRLKAPVGK